MDASSPDAMCTCPTYHHNTGDRHLHRILPMVTLHLGEHPSHELGASKQVSALVMILVRLDMSTIPIKKYIELIEWDYLDQYSCGWDKLPGKPSLKSLGILRADPEMSNCELSPSRKSFARIRAILWAAPSGTWDRSKLLAPGIGPWS